MALIKGLGGIIRRRHRTQHVVIVTVKDTFTRADSTTGIGAADTGQTWLVNWGDATFANVAGISGGELYFPNGPSFNFISMLAAAPHYPRATFLLGGLSGDLILLAAADPPGENAVLLLIDHAGALTLYETLADASTQIGSLPSGTVVADDVVGVAVAADGKACTVYKNGVSILTGAMTVAHTGHYVGIGQATASTAIRIDTFIAKPLVTDLDP